MKKRYGIILVLFVFFLSLNVRALEACGDGEMNRLRELAKNVEFQQEYKINEYQDDEGKAIDVSYSLKVLNDANDLKYTYKISGNDYVFEVLKNEKQFGNFIEGEKVTIQILAYTSNLCAGKVLLTKTVTMPYYNSYYYFKKDTCKTYSDFKYCKELMNTSTLTEEEFEKSLEEYKKSQQEEIKKPEEKKKKDFKLYLIIGGSFLIFLGMIFVVLRLKRGKDKDL